MSRLTAASQIGECISRLYHSIWECLSRKECDKESVVVTLPFAYQVAWQGGSRFRPWSECSVGG